MRRRMTAPVKCVCNGVGAHVPRAVDLQELLDQVGRVIIVDVFSPLPQDLHSVGYQLRGKTPIQSHGIQLQQNAAAGDSPLTTDT